jgi:hypothetical protein
MVTFEGRPVPLPNRGTGLGRDPVSGSFRRIVDMPFEPCVAALENWLGGERPDSELQVGRSRLGGPMMHDPYWGTFRIEVGLARGPLRRRLPMRLEIDRWSWSPSETAFELTSCARVRLTASYFRAGHLLLDSLIHSLQFTLEAQELGAQLRQIVRPVVNLAEGHHWGCVQSK